MSIKSPTRASWFYWTGTKTKGPFSTDEVRALLRTSTVTGETLLSTAENHEWVPLRDVQDFQHWATPILAAYVSESQEQAPNPTVTCAVCGHQFDVSLTIPLAIGGKRLCKLCHAAAHRADGPVQPSLIHRRRRLLVAAAAALLLLTFGGYQLTTFFFPAVSLPLPIWSEARWIQEPAESWPPILAQAEFVDEQNRRVFCGTAFVIQSGRERQPLMVTASRNLLHTAQARNKRSPDELARVIDRLAFQTYHTGQTQTGVAIPRAQGPSMLDGDTLMLATALAPGIRPLTLRRGPLRKGSRITLIAPPAEAGGPQRRFSGTVLKPGDEVNLGSVAMDEVFPAEWLIGAPFVDSSARVAGMLNGEYPVDLSEVGHRNILMFVPAVRLENMARPNVARPNLARP